MKATNDNVATNTTNIATNTASINTLNTHDHLDRMRCFGIGTADIQCSAWCKQEASKITNVLAGTVSSASTDAINGSRLIG
ncbi:hypothetical protein ACNKHR_13610 [Shigella flexneri]